MATTAQAAQAEGEEMTDDGYWTYREWVRHTVGKIVQLSLSCAPEDREDYLRVQIEAAIGQSLRHGRSGRGDDDPVTP